MTRAPRLVVLISGTGSNLQALLDAEQQHLLGGTIVHVVSNRASAIGLRRAEAAAIETTVVAYSDYKTNPDPKAAYDDALSIAVNRHEPDLVILAGFMRILTPTFLEAISVPIINLHPALPGCYAGINAMERAWTDYQNDQVSRSGVMVHEVVEEVDVGPVIDTKQLEMGSFDTFDAFKAAMHELEHALLVEVVQNWCSAFVHDTHHR